MKKVFSILYFILKSVEIIIRIFLTIVICCGIVLTAYFLAYTFLQQVFGNDSSNALNNIYWAAKWWPRIPFWYPGQGAGVSFVWGYPLLGSYLTLFISFWQKLSLINAYKVICFLSFPVTAFGIYFFVWLRLKNQTAGFIASIFYLLMPITYVWLADWGFFAESMAYMFVFPTLIFYDIFLTGIIKKNYGIKIRISLFLAIVFANLTFLTHPGSFFGLFRLIIIYTPIYTFIALRKKRFLQKIILTIMPGLVFITLAIFSSFFISGNYQYYSKYGSSGLNYGAAEKKDFLYFYTTPIKNFLGIGTISPTEFNYTHRNIVVPPLVWILAIAGTIFSFFISAKLVGLVLTGWLSVGLLYNPTLLYYLTKLNLPFFGYFFSMRVEVLLSKLVFPIIASFGVIGLPYVIMRLLTFWIKTKNKIILFFINNSKGIVVAIAAIILLPKLIIDFSNYPRYMWGEDEARYGPFYFNIRDPFNKFNLPNICGDTDNDQTKSCVKNTTIENKNFAYLNFACENLSNTKQYLPQICQNIKTKDDKQTISSYKEFIKICNSNQEKEQESQLCLLVITDKYQMLKKLVSLLKNKDYWPKPNLTSDFQLFPYEAFNKFNSDFGKDPTLRLDVAPTLGGITQSLNIVNQASMINLYTIQLNLMKQYWGYQQQVMFLGGEDPINPTNELAKWFGTKYLLFNNTVDKTTKFENSPDWQDVYQNKSIWHYKKAPELWTLTVNKPTILVIGDLKRQTYETIFRSANKGTLPYDNFWLINGESNFIDDYDFSELKQHQILLLFGYKYKSQTKAFNLLRRYLNEGGNIFISTGWQYVDHDWKLVRTPDFFPIDSIDWNNDPHLEDYQFDKEIFSDIDTSSFGKLEWDNVNWGISIPKNIKPWAKPFLSVGNTPLVVGGNFGKGKIVWTGLNLFGHLHTFNYNQSETLFIKNIFLWLNNNQAEDLSKIVNFKRDYPDKIEFNFKDDINKPATFYFRESYFPNWQAIFIHQGKKIKIPIQKAGPNFKFMFLPKIENGDQLILEFKQLPIQYFYYLTSILTYLFLLINIIFGKKIFLFLFSKIKDFLNKTNYQIKKNWEKE